MRRKLVLGTVAALVMALGGPVHAAMLIGNAGPGTQGIIVDIDTSVPGETFRYNIGVSITGLAVDDGNNILYAAGIGGSWNLISTFDLTTGAELIDPGDRFSAAPYLYTYGLEFLYDETNTGRLFSTGAYDGKNWIIEYELGANGMPTGIKTANPIVDTTDHGDGHVPPHFLTNGTSLAFNTGTGRFYTTGRMGGGVARVVACDADGSATYLYPMTIVFENGMGYADGEVYGLGAKLVHEDLVNSTQVLIAEPPAITGGWGLTGATTPRMELAGGPGDVDGNGVVNGLDLTAVLTAWETIPGDPLWNAAADLDDNDVVNGLDLTEVISNWTVASAAAAPEAGSSEAATADTSAKPGRGNVNRAKGNVVKKNK